MKCYRKHLFKNKQYEIIIDNQSIKIGEVLFNKQTRTQDFKYQIPFKNAVIHFKYEQGQLKAFGFIYKGQLKWFYSNQCDLIKQQLNCKVFFGSITSNYQSQEQLGFGVSCKVYLVKNLFTNIQYASKCIKKDYIFKRPDNERYNRLMQEIAILKMINHQNILKLIEIYEGEQSYYLITDLMKGQSLSKYQKSNLVSMMQVRTMLKHALQALKYLGSLNIIHRDLKPDNIMLRENHDFSSIVIVDFGLACFSNYTHRNVCGTPGYIAPEMFIEGFHYDQKVDVFSLGVIAFRLITNSHFFSGSDSEGVLKNNKKFNCQPIPQFTNDDLTDFLYRMLFKDPKKRLSVEEALNHSWLCETNKNSSYHYIADEYIVDMERTIPQFKAFNSQEDKQVIHSGKMQSKEQLSGYYPSLVGQQSNDQIIEQYN